MSKNITSDKIIDVEDVQGITAPDKILAALKKNKYILDIDNIVGDGWYYIYSGLIRNTAFCAAVGVALTESEEEYEYILKLWIKDNVLYGELSEDDTDVIYFSNKPLMSVDAAELVRENCQYRTMHRDKMTFLDVLLRPMVGVLLGDTTFTRQNQSSSQKLQNNVVTTKKILAEVVAGIQVSVSDTVHQIESKMKSYRPKTKKSMVDSHRHRKWNVPK